MFLSPGEKILKYRKQYQITQGELTDGKISKTYLGMVENGKKALSRKTGMLLFKNLEKILKDRKIELNISYEELMESSEEQARQYLENILKENFFQQSKWMIEEAILKLSLLDQKEFLLRLSDFYLKNDMHNDARINFAKFFQRTSEVKNYGDEFLKFLELSAEFEKYDIVILIFEKYEDELKQLKWTKELEKIYYYYIYSLWKLEGEIDSSEKIALVLKNIKDKKIKHETLKLLGEINFKNKKYTEAVEIYNLILKKAINIDEKINIYYNLIELYEETKNIDELKNVYLKLRRIQERYFEENSNKKFKLFYILGKLADILNRKHECKSYFVEAMVIGKGVEVPLDQVMEMICCLFNMFKKSDYYSLLSIEKEYFNILENYKDYSPAIKLIEYYHNYYPEKLEQKINFINNYLD